MTMTSESVPVVTLADRVPGPKQGEWTYSEYMALPDDAQRYEIVNGVLVMAPASDGSHQDAALWLAHYLLVHVEFAGLGKVRIAPSDVELSPDNVYQPDVFVVPNTHLDRVREKKVVIDSSKDASICRSILCVSLTKSFDSLRIIYLLDSDFGCRNRPA